MKSDAEKYADEDKQKRESVEARNQLDGMTYQLEKLVEEGKEKIPEDEQKEATELVDEVKKTLENSEASAEELSESTGKVIELLQKVGQHLQPAEGEGGQGPQEGDVFSHEEDAAPKSADDKNVVDADFEVVDEGTEQQESEEKTT
jgi:molecular chaperone DnaK